jgi:hypothetical protein
MSDGSEVKLKAAVGVYRVFRETLTGSELAAFLQKSLLKGERRTTGTCHGGGTQYDMPRRK